MSVCISLVFRLVYRFYIKRINYSIKTIYYQEYWRLYYNINAIHFNIADYMSNDNIIFLLRYHVFCQIYLIVFERYRYILTTHLSDNFKGRLCIYTRAVAGQLNSMHEKNFGGWQEKKNYIYKVQKLADFNFRENENPNGLFNRSSVRRV